MSNIKSALLGVAVGDALGVPVEFSERSVLKDNPVTDIIGYGTHNQPPGTFSDDSSLTFCLAEALTEKYDLNSIAENFLKWLYEGYWTAHGNVFDIGIATREALIRFKKGCEPQHAGGFDEYSNGNGSLMRILPLLFYIQDKPVEERYRIIKEVSSITHGHVRSVIACFYYLEFARHLNHTTDLTYIYNVVQREVNELLVKKEINPAEIAVFERLLKYDIYRLQEDEIQSSGYVVHTLEASIWCLMTTKNYKDAVLKAVNLGSDTDTTAAVTGGLAGLLYGEETIPSHWLSLLAKRLFIEDLAERLEKGVQIQKSHFIAELKYRTTEEGGRKSCSHSGYRPALKFAFDAMITTGVQYFLDKEKVYPGETVKAVIYIIAFPYFEKRLEVGMEFDFSKGNIIIGTGVITEIIDKSLEKPKTP